LLSHCPLLQGAVTSYARNCEWTSDVTSQRQSEAAGHGSQGAEIREVHTLHTWDARRLSSPSRAGHPRCCTPSAPAASAEATPHSVSSHGSNQAAAGGLEATTANAVQPNPRRHSI
jgi:hypothetical protein